MPRRVFIIPLNMDMAEAIKQAAANNCPEICQGIPPALVREGKIKEEDLPLVYEEPIIPVVEPRDLGKELDELKEKVKKLESK